MTLMKNSVEIKNSPSRFGRKALAASLALSISFGLVSGVGGNQAQAASLADLFGGAETQGGQEKFLKVEQAFSVKPSQNGNKVNIAL